MKDFSADIEAAIAGDGPISRDKVLRWIHSASDLETLSKLYRLTSEAYDRMQPELGPNTTCGLIQRYLLECVQANVLGNEQIPNRYEATQDLHAWFCHLAEMDEDNTEILKRAAGAITELYLASDADVRNAIEAGFLEHALEMTALWPYFESWSADTRLSGAWHRALEWGKAHPEFTWGLLKQLRKIEE